MASEWDGFDSACAEFEHDAWQDKGRNLVHLGELDSGEEAVSLKGNRSASWRAGMVRFDCGSPRSRFALLVVVCLVATLVADMNRRLGRPGHDSSSRKLSEVSEPAYGHIHWVEDVAQCLIVQGGVASASQGSNLILSACDYHADVFILPYPEQPFMRPLLHPDLCLANAGKTTLQLQLCANTSIQESMLFELRASAYDKTMGTIRPSKNTTRCMVIPDSRETAQIRECDETSTRMLFMIDIQVPPIMIDIQMPPTNWPSSTLHMHRDNETAQDIPGDLMPWFPWKVSKLW